MLTVGKKSTGNKKQKGFCSGTLIAKLAPPPVLKTMILLIQVKAIEEESISQYINFVNDVIDI